jgi:acyl-CoA reductase-like NAD-dependent aldehyde dehydrogenase
MSPLAQTPLRRPAPESFRNYIGGEWLTALLTDVTQALRIARDIEAGTVKINRTTRGNLINAPFGGVKRSSTSTFRKSGRTGLEFYTQIKTIYRGI